MPTSRVTDKVVHRSLHSLDGFLSFEVCIYSFLSAWLLFPVPWCLPCVCRGVCWCACMQMCACVCVCMRARLRAAVCTRACRAAPLLPSPCSAAVTLLQPHSIPGIPGHAGSSGGGAEPLTVCTVPILCYPTRSIHPQKHSAASWCQVGREQQERGAPALVASPPGVSSTHRAGAVHSERGWHCLGVLSGLDPHRQCPAPSLGLSLWHRRVTGTAAVGAGDGDWGADMDPGVLTAVTSVLAHCVMPSGASASCLGLGVLVQCEAHMVCWRSTGPCLGPQCDEDGDAVLLHEVFSRSG